MRQTVDDYIAKGFDRPAAEYYAAGRRKIEKVAANNDFSLTLEFDNGECRLLDMKPLLTEGSVFEPFRNIADFKRVYLDSQNCVSWDIDPNVDSDKTWNNKVDLCPDSCYLDSIPIGGSYHA